MNKLGTAEATTLLVTVMCTKLVLDAPRYIINECANAAYLVMLAKTVIALVIFALVSALYRGFEGDIFDVIKIGGGKSGLKIFGTLIFMAMLMTAVSTMRFSIQSVRTNSMSGSSEGYVALFFMAAAFICAAQGIKSLARTNMVVSFACIGAIVTIFALVSRISEVKNLMPIFGSGVMTLAKASLWRYTLFPEIALIFAALSYIGDYKSARRIGMYAILIGGTLVTTGTLIYCLVIPYPAGASFYQPLYELTRIIRAGSFWQRLDPLIIFVVGAAVQVYLAAAIYFMAYTLKRTFDLPTAHGAAAICAAMIYFLSLIPLDFELSEIMLHAGIIEYPLLPLAAAILARRKVKCEK